MVEYIQNSTFSDLCVFSDEGLVLALKKALSFTLFQDNFLAIIYQGIGLVPTQIKCLVT